MNYISINLRIIYTRNCKEQLEIIRFGETQGQTF